MPEPLRTLVIKGLLSASRHALFRNQNLVLSLCTGKTPLALYTIIKEIFRVNSTAGGASIRGPWLASGEPAQVASSGYRACLQGVPFPA